VSAIHHTIEYEQTTKALLSFVATPHQLISNTIRTGLTGPLPHTGPHASISVACPWQY